MLIQTQARPDRCKQWEDYTPNEYYSQNSGYRQLVRGWEKQSSLPHGKIWREVRVTHQHSELELKKSSKWWDDPMWMDKYFWVYHKPLIYRVDEHHSYRFYALEYYECQRIKDAAVAKFGYNPFTFQDVDGSLYVDHEPSLLIPVECVEVAWEDTQAGYATNIRQQAIERSKAPVPNFVKEREQAIQEAVEQKKKELYDVSNDPKWRTNPKNDEKGV